MGLLLAADDSAVGPVWLEALSNIESSVHIVDVLESAELALLSGQPVALGSFLAPTPPRGVQ